MSSEWDETCRWPRRLLHVDSMTSHGWMPGNVYGGYSDPDYNAISYTWGRWRLKPGQLPEVNSMGVKGIHSWTIPRIDPEHFSAEEFAQVVRSAASANDAFPVKFVWVDVACIDQSESSSDKAAEIGRQGRIFKGAGSVYIWLTTHKWDDLYEWGQTLEKCSSEPEGLEQMVNLIDFLRRDPWFTSLWTLQEAFLCQEAFFLSREGRLLVEEGATWPACRLKDLMNLIGVIYPILLEDKEPHDTNIYSRLTTTLEKSGLRELFLGFPMALLTSAKYRTTSRPEDRVYGIMQVFDLQLGKSVLGSDRDRKFTLSELQDQLGAALLKKDPIMSQLHNHSTPAPLGKGWRVGENSTIPRLASRIYHETDVLGSMEQFASLSTMNIDSGMWGKFEGFVSTIQHQEKVWRQSRPAYATDSENHGFYIALDKIERLGPDVPTPGWAENQVVVASYLLARSPNLVVGLLAVFTGMAYRDRSKPTEALGILLEPMDPGRPGTPWRRAGICHWAIEKSDHEKFKHAHHRERCFVGIHGDSWNYLEGPFG